MFRDLNYFLYKHCMKFCRLLLLMKLGFKMASLNYMNDETIPMTKI